MWQLVRISRLHSVQTKWTRRQAIRYLQFQSLLSSKEARNMHTVFRSSLQLNPLGYHSKYMPSWVRSMIRWIGRMRSQRGKSSPKKRRICKEWSKRVRRVQSIEWSCIPKIHHELRCYTELLDKWQVALLRDRGKVWNKRSPKRLLLMLKAWTQQFNKLVMIHLRHSTCSRSTRLSLSKSSLLSCLSKEPTSTWNWTTFLLSSSRASMTTSSVVTCRRMSWSPARLVVSLQLVANLRRVDHQGDNQALVGMVNLCRCSNQLLDSSQCMDMVLLCSQGRCHSHKCSSKQAGDTVACHKQWHQASNNSSPWWATVSLCKDNQGNSLQTHTANLPSEVAGIEMKERQERNKVLR